jgi:hypothetical protein
METAWTPVLFSMSALFCCANKETQLRKQFWNKQRAAPVEINARTFNCDARNLAASAPQINRAREYSGAKGELG